MRRALAFALALTALVVDAPTSARMRALGVAHVAPWLADAFAA